jgi:hypothetical protein
VGAGDEAELVSAHIGVVRFDIVNLQFAAGNGRPANHRPNRPNTGYSRHRSSYRYPIANIASYFDPARHSHAESDCHATTY